MSEFSLNGSSYIALHNLLKIEGWCESGAVAKQVIDSGLVSVNGKVELRKRCKIIAGQCVEYNGEDIRVVE